MMVIMDGETAYPLSDADRSYKMEAFPSWESTSRGIAGNLSITQGPSKRRWTLSWAKLKSTTADDGGVGLNSLLQLYMARKAYILRVYKNESDYTPYNVAIRSLSADMVPFSSRTRYAVNMVLEEI